MSSRFPRGFALLSGFAPLLLATAVMGESSQYDTTSTPVEATDDAEVGVGEELTLDPDPVKPGSPRQKPFIVNVRGEYQFDTGIDTAGDFGVVRIHGGAGMRFPISDRFGMAVGGGYTFAGYDFDSDAAFGGGEPWENIHTFQATVLASYSIDPTWSVFGGGVLALSGEDDADAGDSMTGGGMIGAGYRASERLSVRLGVSVNSQIEDDVSIMPVVLVNWTIDEHWNLRVGSLDTGAVDAIGAGLTYKLSDQWSLGGQLGWVHSRFRLDDSGFAPDGVGQDERAKGLLVLRWDASESLTLGVFGGVAFGGELRIEDEDGDRLFKEDYDATPFAGARLVWRF